jgi:hypothetical protein
MRNALSLVDRGSQDILRQLHNQGAISIPELKEVHRATKEEQRVIEHKDMTIHESIRTTVEQVTPRGRRLAQQDFGRS